MRNQASKQSTYPPYDFVHRVDHDDLKVLVHRVLIDPVRVEHPQAAAPPSHSLFSYAPQVALELELGDTLVDRLSVDDTFAHRALAAAAADADAVDNVALARREEYTACE